MENGQKVLFGVITGLLAGTVIGLLLAPNKGEETRQKLLETAKNLKLDTESLKPTLERLSDLTKTAIDTISEYATRYLSKAQPSEKAEAAKTEAALAKEN
ncbi:MAG: YtxH domain-containing protein [Microscillaceae bacterium]|nr:YtxH domain-containing protein [Microscillaceae bacterium]MDW8460789.1 YtxH domain-containing protein [Cytophagales bacterium]